MIKTAVIGGTGYAGQELLRILYRHPNVEIISIGSKSYVGTAFNAIYHNFEGITNLDCSSKTIAELSAEEKNALSHRGKAGKVLSKVINALYS